MVYNLNLVGLEFEHDNYIKVSHTQEPNIQKWGCSGSMQTFTNIVKKKQVFKYIIWFKLCLPSIIPKGVIAKAANEG